MCKFTAEGIQHDLLFYVFPVGTNGQGARLPQGFRLFWGMRVPDPLAVRDILKFLRLEVMLYGGPVDAFFLESER